jgi:hypothetical protein
LLLLFLPLVSLDAQFRNRRTYSGDPNEFYVPPDFNGNVPYDGRFTFARIKYRGYDHFGPEGPGWSHDYPRAEEHLMRIMREISTIRPFIERSGMLGGVIVALDEKELFKYPVAYLSEPGGWHPNETEMAGMRNYLLKGGFVIFDDFDVTGRGPGSPGDWERLKETMARVLPKHRMIPVPPDHPIFDSFYKIDLSMLERSEYGVMQYYGIFQDNDPRKRLMAIANLNGDLGEFWQWEARGYNIAPTNEAYKLGVNYLMYALTH